MTSIADGFHLRVKDLMKDYADRFTFDTPVDAKVKARQSSRRSQWPWRCSSAMSCRSRWSAAPSGSLIFSTPSTETIPAPEPGLRARRPRRCTRKPAPCRTSNPSRTRARFAAASGKSWSSASATPSFLSYDLALSAFSVVAELYEAEGLAELPAPPAALTEIEAARYSDRLSALVRKTTPSPQGGSQHRHTPH